MDMPINSRNDRYRGRMNRVADAIAAALEEGRNPTIEELADAAALSAFHFHRVYRLQTGETVADTVQRLKVAQALHRVSAGDSVTEAAQAAGYSSSQTLAKAVRQRTGASVTELRRSGQLAEQSEQLKSGTRGEGTMTLELTDTSPIRIACRMAVGPYDRLNLAYRSLFEDFCAAADPAAITGVYGIPVDDPREVLEAEHRFIGALAVGEGVTGLFSGIELRELGGGRHAVLRHRGPYSEIPAALDALYEQVLDAGLELGSTETFIHYVDQPDAADGPDVVHESHIYVPVSS